jgi:hypothetical protein
MVADSGRLGRFWKGATGSGDDAGELLEKVVNLGEYYLTLYDVLTRIVQT